MTPEQRVVLYFFALVAVWAVYQATIRFFKCQYCGGIKTHEDHCPWHTLDDRVMR